MVNIKLIHILECQENFFFSLSNEIVLHVFQAGWRQLIFFFKSIDIAVFQYKCRTHFMGCLSENKPC